MSELTFSHLPDRQCYALVDADGGLAAICEYEPRGDGDVLVFHHTEVGDAWNGRGVASRVVRHALDHVRESGATVIPTCWFVRGWIERHPDYHDLVAHLPG